MKRLGNNATNCGDIQGNIKGTHTQIKLGSVQVALDAETAWALCNVLSQRNIESVLRPSLEQDQLHRLVNLGEAIAAFIDHPNRNFKL